MTSLSLRLRIFLFFCLLRFGGVAIVSGAAWLGYRQLGNPEALSAFITVVIISALGLLGIAWFVWLLFDEHVSKPLEALAAQFRVRAVAGIDAEVDDQAARYLGDLAPAACLLQDKLTEISSAVDNIVSDRTKRLEQQRDQLLQLLSDVPSATVLVTRGHQITLYDGQAAELMEATAPARLLTSVFEYLEESEIRGALKAMESNGSTRRAVALTSKCGSIFSGQIRRYDPGDYALMLDPLDPEAARSLVYDFGLLDKPEPQAMSETSLSDLVFVVFDTETTALNPKTDEVVQLAAVRVVNGRIIASETFEHLVHPGMAIPPGSTRVHKVTSEMVVDAPPFSDVSQKFHQFCQGGVLVAHNAPFDMAFLQRETARGGPGFDHPALDTVHLSAIVFGASATHTLDALCERLDIKIAPERRHTALGDALASAEAIVAMLPVLKESGLDNLRAIKEESRKYSHVLQVV